MELDGLNVVGHLANNAFVLVILFIVDRFAIAPYVKKHVDKKSQGTARWFFIHAFANLFVVVSSLPALGVVMRDPTHSMDGHVYTDRSFFGTSSRWPLTIINSVHAYHMVGGFGLTAADWFHHVLFIPALGFPAQIFNLGALCNWQAFFISGLPGGIDYFLLGLIKCGTMDHMLEKRVNANMNVWCRAPGILVATVLGYCHFVNGNYSAPLLAVVPQLFLPGYGETTPLARPPHTAAGPVAASPRRLLHSAGRDHSEHCPDRLPTCPLAHPACRYNALYFCKQACANYAVHYMLNLLGQDELIKERIKMRTSLTTGTEVMAWKDAVGVPQRGS
jgi:hypothetical protein